MSLPSARRRELLHALALALSAGSVSSSVLGKPTRSSESSAESDLAQLESRHGGRLGVFALDTGSGRSLGWRADQGFALCSTFKLLLAGVLMRQAEAGALDLGEKLAFSESDRVPHMPVTGPLLERGGGKAELSILALAEATQKTSDNLAANVLVARLGGPERLTRLLRELGDTHTRIDRLEPAMNLVPKGEIRDTSTPQAMATSTAALLAGDALNDTHRAQLKQWMLDTRTGLRRIRAGLPEAWQAGDKTGTALHPSMSNKHNDVAVAWPPGRAPIVIAAYYEADAHYPEMRAEDDAVLAEVGRIAAAWASTAVSG